MTKELIIVPSWKRKDLVVYPLNEEEINKESSANHTINLGDYIILDNLYNILYNTNVEIKKFILKYGDMFKRFIERREMDIKVSIRNSIVNTIKKEKITIPYYIVREPILSYIIQKKIKLPKYEVSKKELVGTSHRIIYNTRINKYLEFKAKKLDKKPKLKIPPNLPIGRTTLFTKKGLIYESDVSMDGNYSHKKIHKCVVIRIYRKNRELYNEDFLNDLKKAFEEITHEETDFNKYIDDWAKKLLIETTVGNFFPTESLINANRESEKDSPNSNPTDLNSRGKPSASSPSLCGGRLA